MRHSTRAALAASAFACAALLSFVWSERSGLSIAVESAEARVGRPLTPMSVAGSTVQRIGALTTVRQRRVPQLTEPIATTGLADILLTRPATEVISGTTIEPITWRKQPSSPLRKR
jgi:hypothetical protein